MKYLNRLPLPDRDMLPGTIEEQIVCYADKFYSKNGDRANGEKSIETITRELSAFGKDKAKIFLQWMEQLGC